MTCKGSRRMRGRGAVYCDRRFGRNKLRPSRSASGYHAFNHAYSLFAMRNTPEVPLMDIDCKFQTKDGDNTCEI